LSGLSAEKQRALGQEAKRARLADQALKQAGGTYRKMGKPWPPFGGKTPKPK
jgi:hypothetical protein